MRQLLRITVTFALALVFSAGMAFGQSNETTVDQVGDDHDANVTQQGGNNDADVTQLNNANQKFVEGLARDVLGGGTILNEFTPSGNGENFLRLLQDGADNEADVQQAGELNEIFLDQSGGAFAEVDQGGTGNLLDGFAGDAIQRMGSELNLSQDGNNNTLLLNQEGGINEANLLQVGNGFGVISDGATAYIDQDGGGNVLEGIDETKALQSGNFELDLTQTGSNNEAYIRQQGAFSNFVIGPGDPVGAGGTISLEQEAGSEATIDQRKAPGGTETLARLEQDGSTADVFQGGDGNKLVGVSESNDQLSLVGSGAATQKSGADLTLTQDGGNDDAGVFQNAGTATIEQFGGNEALLYQDGANTTNITQNGSNESASVLQDGAQNFSDLEQSGDMNEATVTQDGFPEGFGNESRLDQTNGSEADVDQYGDNNYFSGDGPRNTFASQDNSILTLDQIGDQNWTGVDQTDSEATITQDGTKNKTMLTQSNGSDATVTQEGNGPYNVARLTQDDGDLTLTQEGNNNTTRLVQTSSDATITQDGFRSEVRLNQDNSSTATVTQEGTNHKLFGLGGPSFAAQDNSTLTLTQTGDRNRAYVDQSGSTATINQNGTNNTTTVDQQP